MPRPGRDHPALRQPETPKEMGEAAKLLWEVWGATTPRQQTEVASKTWLQSLAHSGNYLIGAYLDHKLVGCCVGFVKGPPEHSLRRRALRWLGMVPAGRVGGLYTHMIGVAPERQGRGVGFALMRHQWRWALDRGIVTGEWTFDPLELRNGYFHLHKLGAVVKRFEPDFWGPVDDGINDGKSTGRFIVEWPLRSPRVERAMAGKPVPLAYQYQDNSGAEVVKVPDGIYALRTDDPKAAKDQEDAVYQQLTRLCGNGYQVVGMTSDRNGYVLLPPRNVTGRRPR